MDREIARALIEHAVRTTEPRWRQYGERWANIDEVFLRRGYEQQGFEVFRFLPILKIKGCGTIEALGSIPRASEVGRYASDLARGLESPFYKALAAGKRGEMGSAFYEAVSEFLQPGKGRKGSGFWMQLWRLLQACRFLKEEHQASFRGYLLARFARFRDEERVDDSALLGLDPASWQAFLSADKPWQPLYGIGRDTFDFIMGDFEEAEFAAESFKFDSANRHYLEVTGISDLIGDLSRDVVIDFLSSLGLDWKLRQINKGIYTYCSETEASNFGFCRDREDCGRCAVASICARRLELRRDAPSAC